MLKMLRDLHDALTPAIAQVVEELEEKQKEEERKDADDDERVKRLIRRLTKEFFDEMQPDEIRNVPKLFVEQASQRHLRFIKSQAKKALGSELLITDSALSALLDSFVEENVALIKDVLETTAEQVGELAGTAVREGISTKRLTDQIQKTMKTNRNRARLIARDQVGKANSKITQSRHKELGIEGYFWRTVNDERVRDAHEELEGQWFSYESGGHPTEGHPGEPIQCRCYQEPDFSSVVGQQAA